MMNRAGRGVGRQQKARHEPLPAKQSIHPWWPLEDDVAQPSTQVIVGMTWILFLQRRVSLHRMVIDRGGPWAGAEGTVPTVARRRLPDGVENFMCMGEASGVGSVEFTFMKPCGE